MLVTINPVVSGKPSAGCYLRIMAATGGQCLYEVWLDSQEQAIRAEADLHAGVCPQCVPMEVFQGVMQSGR